MSNSSELIESAAPRVLDPVYVHARREAFWILGVYASCLVWAVVWSGLLGYGPPGEAVPTLFGVPRWVFIAIGLPWLAADAFTVWFCFFYMVDDDLDGELDESHDAPRAGSGVDDT